MKKQFDIYIRKAYWPSHGWLTQEEVKNLCKQERINVFQLDTIPPEPRTIDLTNQLIEV